MLVETITLGPVETNCYIYSADGKAAVIIDPATDGADIIAQLDALRLHAVAIVNTHGHLDHTGANADLRRALDVPIYIGAGDALYLGPTAAAVHRQDALLIGPEAVAVFQEYYKPSPAADVLLHEGDVIPGVGLAVLETPGHTAGHISLVGEDIVFTGDTLFAGSVGRTDLCGGDEGLLLSSIRRKLFTLPGATEVFPGHGPPTTIAEEKAHNPFLA